MTKKQNLHYETIRIQNEIRSLQGKADMNIDLDSYSQTENFVKYCDRRTTAELEKELAIAEQALLDATKKIALEEWLISDEGKAYIKERKDKIDVLWNANRTILREGRKHVSEVVKGLLGDQWDVTRFNDGHMEVAIVEKYREDGSPEGLFGHEFEVYFGHDWKLTKEGTEEYYRWEMNYGTMGSFDLFESGTRAQHLIGMGRFAGDTEVVPQLKDYLQKMSDKIRRNHKVIDGLEEEIKNPVIG